MDSRALRGSLSWIMRVPLRLVISVQQRVLSEGSAGRTRQHTRTACWCADDIAAPAPAGASVCTRCMHDTRPALARVHGNAILAHISARAPGYGGQEVARVPLLSQTTTTNSGAGAERVSSLATALSPSPSLSLITSKILNDKAW